MTSQTAGESRQQVRHLETDLRATVEVMMQSIRSRSPAQILLKLRAEHAAVAEEQALSVAELDETTRRHTDALTSLGDR